MEPIEHDTVLANATAIVQQTLKEGTATMSPADVATLVAATVRDIVQVCHQDEARLNKVEAQTRVLAEAVLAITEPADAVAPAVRAVKSEMSTD
jgi:hypothetical protein